MCLTCLHCGEHSGTNDGTRFRVRSDLMELEFVFGTTFSFFTQSTIARGLVDCEFC